MKNASSPGLVTPVFATCKEDWVKLIKCNNIHEHQVTQYSLGLLSFQSILRITS